MTKDLTTADDKSLPTYTVPRSKRFRTEEEKRFFNKCTEPTRNQHSATVVQQYSRPLQSTPVRHSHLAGGVLCLAAARLLYPFPVPQAYYGRPPVRTSKTEAGRANMITRKRGGVFHRLVADSPWCAQRDRQDASKQWQRLRQNHTRQECLLHTSRHELMLERQVSAAVTLREQQAQPRVSTFWCQRTLEQSRLCPPAYFLSRRSFTRALESNTLHGVGGVEQAGPAGELDCLTAKNPRPALPAAMVPTTPYKRSSFNSPNSPISSGPSWRDLVSRSLSAGQPSCGRCPPSRSPTCNWDRRSTGKLPPFRC